MTDFQFSLKIIALHTRSKRTDPLIGFLIPFLLVFGMLLPDLLFRSPAFAEDYTTQDICEAIAWQETKLCTEGVGKTKKNCVGLRRGGEFVEYNTIIESISDCMEVWDRSYGGMPDLSKAQRWSGEGGTLWLRNVLWHLYRH